MYLWKNNNMNTKEVINNNRLKNTNKQKHLQIDGVTALFKDGEELGVVSGFDVVSGCWCWFDIVFVCGCDYGHVGVAYMQKTCDVAEKAILAKKNLWKKCLNRNKM